MYVKRVSYDETRDIIREFLNPTWEDVEALINKMDGKSITQITMDNGDECNYLCVGGGNDGYYNVFISEDDNEINFTLTKENYDAGLEHQLVTGGQWGDFEDRICVSVDVVIKVAKIYFEKGEKDDSYSWE